MSFLEDVNLNDCFEYESMPEGEYNLRIMDINRKTSQKTGGDFIMARIEIVNEPKSKDINHVMMLPTAADDVKQRNNRILAINRFMKAFGFDPTAPPTMEEMIGAVTERPAYLVEEENEEYGTQNRIRRFNVD